MYEVPLGDRRVVYAHGRRRWGSGAFTVTNPERRVLSAAGQTIANFDWAAATWDSTYRRLSALFDSTLAGIDAKAAYYMQLRATVGPERYTATIEVRVI